MTKHTRPKPEKPYPDFPLFAHASRQWCKKIRGKPHYFGVWEDPHAALSLYLSQKEDLLAGRQPQRKQAAGMSIGKLCNRYMAAKDRLLESGEIVKLTHDEYYAICKLLVDRWGGSRQVATLGPDDFGKLRLDLAKSLGPTRLGNQVQRIRGVFKFGYDEGLLPRTPIYGQQFKRPSTKTLRQHKARQGLRMAEAAEVRQVLASAGPVLEAIVLLGLNCGFGNADIARLKRRNLDLRGGWVNYARGKTGVQRRCPLWPETIEAIRKALKYRPVRNTETAGLVFVTKQGHAFGDQQGNHAVSQEFAKLCRKAGVARKGLNFYALRHTTETIGGEAKDQPALDHIMGHAPSSTNMAAVYRERISDARLRAVADEIRNWLWPQSWRDEQAILRREVEETAGHRPNASVEETRQET